MAHYKISGTVDGTRIDQVMKKAKEVFGDGVRVEKIERNQSRADRLGEAEDLASQAKEIVEELAMEMEQWYDNLPENFQSGDKGSRIEECKDALQEIVDALEQCDFSGLDFPGMYD